MTEREKEKSVTNLHQRNYCIKVTRRLILKRRQKNKYKLWLVQKCQEIILHNRNMSCTLLSEKYTSIRLLLFCPLYIASTISTTFLSVTNSRVCFKYGTKYPQLCCMMDPVR